MHIYNTYMNHIEKIKWFCIITICLSITFIYYFFLNKFSTLGKIITLCFFGITLLNIFVQTNTAKLLLFFAKNLKLELSNIVWPNYVKTIQTTMIVVLLIILTSIFFWILDGIILHIISRILVSES